MNVVGAYSLRPSVALDVNGSSRSRENEIFFDDRPLNTFHDGTLAYIEAWGEARL